MGKSDLIDKINARVKSQLSSLNARNAAKAKADEKDERSADLGEKRITNSRTGTVVVRRRVPPRGEGEPMSPAGTPEYAAQEARYPESGPVLETRGGPSVDLREPPQAPVYEPVRPVERLEAEELESGPEAAMELEPLKPAVSPAAATPARSGPAPQAQAPSQAEAAPAAVAEPVVPVSRPTAEAVKPAAVEAERPVEQPGAAPVAEPRAQAAVPRAATPSEVQPMAAAAERESAAHRAPPAQSQPSGPGSHRTRSIEEILAQERGHVPVQRRAMVVGDARHLVQGREPARPERVPAGAAPATSAPAPTNAQPGTPGQGQTRRPPASPTSVKEMANEERKKEKAAVKAVVPGRQPARGVAVESEADRIARTAKAKKTMKKKEVLQRRDVTSESEPQFRKQRRVVAKREKGKTKITTPKAIKRVIKIEDTISVGELAHRMGVKAPAVIKKLMGLGMMATINQAVDHDTATMVASDFGYEVENVAFDETALLAETEDQEEDLVRRPPVVTVMGHVDHGKTTLLDAIRNTDVAAGEAGGITQHIGAYSVETKGGRIVFLDTPGHEAFTSMRARGAQVTDIVILVVAADDGVMPQTVEALNHAKEAKVPIIVAVNKIDKPGANPERIRQKLSEYELVPEEWGGQTIFCEVSAKSRRGIEELLEYILLQAEVLELEANPNRQARATVIESELDKGRGPVATVLVNNGTLRVGDVVVVGAQYGKVRAMVDDRGRSVKEAGPSMPVEILGLSGVPDAGDIVAVVEDLDTARSIAENRSDKAREQNMARSAKVSLEDLFSQLQKSEVKELKLILKTDVQGSLGALEKAIKELSTDAVKTNVLHSGVGVISEGDVMLASASKAVIIGFNVKPDQKAATLAEQESVQIKTYSIIYEALDELKLSMQGMLAPILKEKVIGHAEVRNTFSIPRIGLIAGSSVTDGKITRGSNVRVLRGGKMVWEGKLGSLKRFKDDVKEVEKGYECGIGLDSFTDIKLGDIIEAYIIEETRATL